MRSQGSKIPNKKLVLVRDLPIILDSSEPAVQKVPDFVGSRGGNDQRPRLGASKANKGAPAALKVGPYDAEILQR